MKRSLSFFVLFALMAPAAALPVRAEKVAPDTIAKIKDEGMNRSQAMDTIQYLTDVIGPRLTNSPAQRRANAWTRERLEKWGLKNAVVEPWGEFGRGWEVKRFSASYAAGSEAGPLRAYPKAWSPSTNGPVTSEVIYVDAADEAGLEKYKGRLKGAIVLTGGERKVEPGFKPAASRVSDEQLAKLEGPNPPQYTPPVLTPEQKAAQEFAARKLRFYFEEGAAVLIDPGTGTDSGTIRVMGASLPPGTAAGIRVASKNAPATITQITAEVEQYNRILRLLKQGVPVRLTVDLEAKFYEEDLQGYNTIAEIPGTDLKDEIVMIGAHLDSWHAGTGATDNAAGVTVVMEAMRILQALGIKPRRTIRVGLWTGEEQGLLGAKGYVSKHFASIDANKQVVPKPGYDNFAAYYNLDNGTGQIRGIYMQGNEALRPIFREWFAPFKEYGSTTLTSASTSGTDHLAFDEVGLPGFQFIQDEIEYFARTWHTTQDVVDRILIEDIKRSSVIMAAMALNSAMADEKLPRKSKAAPVASLLSGFDLAGYLDEVAFRRSGIGFSVCGHAVEAAEVLQGFPAYLAATHRGHDHSE
jgi:carboxypeptidase Q